MLAMERSTTVFYQAPDTRAWEVLGPSEGNISMVASDQPIVDSFSELDIGDAIDFSSRVAEDDGLQMSANHIDTEWDDLWDPMFNNENEAQVEAEPDFEEEAVYCSVKPVDVGEMLDHEMVEHPITKLVSQSTSSADMFTTDTLSEDDADGDGYDVPLASDTLIAPEASEINTSEQYRDPNLQALEALELSRYDLRPGPREQQDEFQVIAFDQDETGDYDVEEERKRNRVVRKRRVRFVDDEDVVSKQRRARTCKDDSPEEQLLCIIRLAESSKQHYRTIVDQYTAKIQQAEAGAYRLRRRPSDLALSDATHRVRDTNNTPNSFIGHPVGRGCLECLNIGARCPMLDNEFDWPCHACAEGEHECIPVLPPKKKTACSNCEALEDRCKWLICSYEYEDEHDKPCRHCAATGATNSCFAGPDLAEIPQRIYIKDDGQPHRNERPEIETQHKPRRSCVACQVGRRHCSLSDDLKYEANACIACEMDGSSCQPISTDKAQWTKLSWPVVGLSRQDSAGQAQQRVPSVNDTAVKGTSSTPNEQQEVVKAPQDAQQSEPVEEMIELSDSSDPGLPKKRRRTSKPQKTSSQATTASTKRASFRKKDFRQRHQLSAIQYYRNHVPARGQNAAVAVPQRHALNLSSVPAATPLSNAGGPAVVLLPQIRNITMKKFMSKLCHPISFNHDNSANAASCHFCCEPGYAILGLPDTEILAIKLDSGKGWLERNSKPPREPGMTSTRVCIRCTAARFEIIHCTSHVLERVTGATPQSLHDAVQQLDAGVSSGPWCSICCNLATHACCADPTDDGVPNELHDGPGCGLKLCQHCVFDMNVHDNSLQAVLLSHKLINGRSEKRPYGLRADWDLLKRGGLLEQYILGC